MLPTTPNEATLTSLDGALKGVVPWRSVLANFASVNAADVRRRSQFLRPTDTKLATKVVQHKPSIYRANIYRPCFKIQNWRRAVGE